MISATIKRQKKNRETRKRAIKNGTVALLDFGSTKISCFIIKILAGKESKKFGDMDLQSSVQIIGHKTIKSNGIDGGEIVRILQTETDVMRVLSGAMKQAGERVDFCIASISGGKPRSFISNSSLEMHNKSVGDSEISRVMSAAVSGESLTKNLSKDRTILHSQPVNFSIDNRTGLRDPRGQIGNQISADLHTVTIERYIKDDLENVLNKCDLQIADIVIDSYSAALATLIEDELSLGVACIDIGGGTANISLFKKNELIGTSYVPIGGDDITRDISTIFQVTHATAEKIKVTKGACFSTYADDKAKISIKSNTGDWSFDNREITRADLISVMLPRLEEIFFHIREKLCDLEFQEIGRKIVITGGVSQTQGILDLAEKILGADCRHGRPSFVRGLPDEARGPEFSASCGLIKCLTSPNDEIWDFEFENENPRGVINKAIQWLRENW
jgi:cell division protein FtsA